MFITQCQTSLRTIDVSISLDIRLVQHLSEYVQITILLMCPVWQSRRAKFPFCKTITMSLYSWRLTSTCCDDICEKVSYIGNNMRTMQYFSLFSVLVLISWNLKLFMIRRFTKIFKKEVKRASLQYLVNYPQTILLYISN